MIGIFIMTMSKKPSKKNQPKGKHIVGNLSPEIIRELPSLAGLHIKIEPSNRNAKTRRPKRKYTYEITDINTLKKDLEGKKKIAAMINPAPTSLDHYLSVSDPSDAIRSIRKVVLEHLIQTARLTGQDVNEALLDANQIKAFLEGLELLDADRVEHAKAFFFNSILMFAKLPLDPRREIELMIKALAEVQKALPKRKPGRKEDETLTRAWRRIDFDQMKHRDAYKLYMMENGIDAYDQNEFKVFQEKIRKKRLVEKQKQARQKVAAEMKRRRQNSSS